VLVICPVVLIPDPAPPEVTLTLKVHVVEAASDAPESEIVELAATADIVPDGHDPVSPFGVATTMFVGRVSEKAMPFRVVDPFGLPAVKVTVAPCP